MEDKQLHEHISRLVAEERALEEGHVGARATPEQEARLGEIRVTLDQYWDLLRQRQARREFGQDPSSTGTRPADVVEGYQQ
jgi:hypothetical protein